MIRGEQLGSAIGATVKPNAQLSDCLCADVIVVVKRTPTVVLEAIAKSGRPWVFDVVDGWPQPAGNEWGRKQAVSWLRAELQRLRPTAVVFGTREMQADADFSGPSLVLPHHAWPKYSPISIRDRIRIVGYEGAARYLGKWQAIIESECRLRGWSFVINGNMAKCDIGIALRDVCGYPAMHWKPGTKLSNLQALGLPALVSPECGYRAQASNTEFWIECAEDVIHAFDALQSKDVREKISLAQQGAAPRLAPLAEDYLKWLSTLRF